MEMLVWNGLDKIVHIIISLLLDHDSCSLNRFLVSLEGNLICRCARVRTALILSALWLYRCVPVTDME